MSKHDLVCNEHPSGEVYIRERSPRGRVICRMAYTGTTQPKIDGATIVRAVNSHAALVEALKKAAWFIENVDDETPNRTELFFEARSAWRAALALAKGE